MVWSFRSTNVAWVRFRPWRSIMVWVCWFSTLLWEVFFFFFDTNQKFDLICCDSVSFQSPQSVKQLCWIHWGLINVFIILIINVVLGYLCILEVSSFRYFFGWIKLLTHTSSWSTGSATAGQDAGCSGCWASLNRWCVTQTDQHHDWHEDGEGSQWIDLHYFHYQLTRNWWKKKFPHQKWWQFGWLCYRDYNDRLLVFEGQWVNVWD